MFKKSLVVLQFHVYTNMMQHYQHADRGINWKRQVFLVFAKMLFFASRNQHILIYFRIIEYYASDHGSIDGNLHYEM